MRSPIQRVIFSLFIFSLYYVITVAEDSPCGDWEPYKDEKCLKIFDKVGLQSYEDAEKTCHQQEDKSSLIYIRSLEENHFLSNLLFNKSHIVDNVWIGAKYISNKFKWSDDSDLSFTNWAQGSPRNGTDYCVQMHSDPALIGKWVDEPCKKKNLVVCQKMPTWSLSRLTQAFLDLKKNPVPIGFIYVQLPNEKSPTEIWPWMTWNDMSSAYAGIFFRVTGGKSASFGQVQEDNAPQLAEVDSNYFVMGMKQVNGSPLKTSKGGWSDWIYSGGQDGSGRYLRFQMSDGEVRPRNMAIRIWKRTG